MKQPLLLHGYGIFLGAENGVLTVREQKIITEKITTSDVNLIVCFGDGLAVSSTAISLCANHNIPIIFLDGLGRVQAHLVSPHLRTNLELHTLQYVWCRSSDSLLYCAGLLRKKFQRQTEVIHYHARSLRQKNTCVALHRHKFDYFSGPSMDDVQDMFLMEARMAKQYWQAMQKILPVHVGFTRRTKRNARDPFNKLLNYGYGVLASLVLKNLIIFGFDPTVGFLHHRQNALYPLVYDLMEPFRPLIDHAVLITVHRQHASLLDLHSNLRRAVLRRFRKTMTHVGKRPQPWSRDRRSLETLIQEEVDGLKQQLQNKKSVNISV